MDRIHLLGYSPVNLPLILDILEETVGQVDALIYMNIELENPPLFETNNQYNFKFIKNSNFNTLSKPYFFGVTNAYAKKKIYEYFYSEYQLEMKDFISINHPTSYIARSAQINNGCLIEPNVTVSSQTVIDFGVTLKRGALIGHHNKIGPFSSINPGCVLSGNINIGTATTIGSGTVIKNNISIGSNTIIGAGSNVVKNIPSDCIAYGNPCKVKKLNERNRN